LELASISVSDSGVIDLEELSDLVNRAREIGI